MADLKRRIIAEFSAKNKAKGVMGGFRRDLDVTGRALRRMAVGALAVAGIGGMGYMLKKQMEIIDSTAKLSDRLNITTESLIAMQHGAGIAGVEQETLNKSLEIFVRRLGEVDMGVGQAKYALDKLGLDYKELIGLSADEAFGKIADQIKGLATQAEKAAAANYLFGRSGQSLLNFFEKGSEGLKEYKEFVEKTGLAFSRMDAAQVEAANDALMNVRAALAGIFRQATIELAPYIELLANKFVDLATAGEGVGANVVNAFEAMSKGAIQFGQIIHGTSAKMKAFLAGALEGAAGFLELSAKIEKYSPMGGVGRLTRKITGAEDPADIAKRYRQQAAELMESATKEAESLYGQISAIEKFYDDLRKKAAGETTKTIKEQYADVLRAKIDMVDKEMVENERKLAEAKKSAEEETNIIIKAAQEHVKFVREQDYMTRQQRIDNLNAYVEANETALNLVLEANKIIADELKKLERGKFEDTKRWLTESADLWKGFDKTVAKALDGMANALTDLCLTGKADFKDLALSIIYDITRMMIKYQMYLALQAMGIGGAGQGGGFGIGDFLMAGVGALFGGGGPLASATVQPAGQTVFAYPGMEGYQHGGIATRPHLAMVGEVPEAFVPLSGGRSIPVEMRGGGGNDFDVHIHNEGQEKLKISKAESYILSDKRILNVTTKAMQTDLRYRRSISQVRP